MSVSNPRPGSPGGLGRRAVLAGLAAASAGTVFASRAEAATATVAGEENYLTVRGLGYVADPQGTALTTADGRRWSPNGEITPLHFGETSDDDTAIVQAAIDHAAALAARTLWDDTLSGPFHMQVVVSGLNRLYRVSRPIVLGPDNRGAIIRDFSIVAVGDGWATDGGRGRVGDQDYRPAKSDFIFRGKAGATYVLYENLKLNCNDRCGGIRVLARSRVVNCFIKKCAGVGVAAGAGDVWIDRCIIKQFDQNDLEFFDPARFTGIGVLCEESDLRVTHCVISWLAECARVEGTNCTFAHCHIFNGCRRYLGRYVLNKDEAETRDAALNAALSAYFGRTIDDDTDLAPRPYHAGIVVTGPLAQDNSFDSIYFDNCHMEIYAHGVHFNEPKLGSKPNESLWASPIDYWFAVYPASDGDIPQIVVDEVMIFVESRPKRLVAFKPHPATGDRWALDYAAVTDTGYDFGSSARGDRFRIDVPQVHMVNQPVTALRPAVTYVAPQAGASIGFTDPAASRALAFGGDPDLRPWETGVQFRLGQRCHVGLNVYEKISRGQHKAGRKAPQHGQGIASDGRIDWLFAGTLDPVPVRFGGHADRARIMAPNGQLVVGALDAPVFRGAEGHAVAIRTGDSGVAVPPPEGADDLTIEAGGDGGLSIAIPDGARARVAISTPSDARRFEIEFDDATGRINFLVGGVVVQTLGG